MLLVIVGAGASFDSIPSRLPGESTLESLRPPLADQLFDARELFERVQRLVPQVMPIVPSLSKRRSGESVEDVMARYAGELKEYEPRRTQLAAARFYIQGIIADCERGWYRDNQVPTNLMTLIDQIEAKRRARERPLFVTFNYDRMIENALENRGQSFASLEDYVRAERIRVIKLHGSVDWARTIQPLDQREFGGGAWDIANQVSSRIATLPQPGKIVRWETVPSSNVNDQIALPALALPLKLKPSFECPEDHVDALKATLPRVRTVLTLGWRGAEHPFLDMLRERALQGLNVICVGSGVGAAEETIKNLQGVLDRAHFEPYNDGFSQFVRDGRLERLLNITWEG